MRKLRLLPLIAATYFMVSGGPYGLEDAVGAGGYRGALILIALVPLFWSLPTALMVGELASAMPEEGGFYVWVTRALGGFWGFQEAWLSLAASIFDMAIYPALAVSYLAQLSPALVSGHRGIYWSLGIVAVCTLWNLRGAAPVGEASVVLLIVLLLPFVAITVLALYRSLGPGHAFAGPAVRLAAVPHQWALAVLIIMWNTMGWDNASTVAREVEQPQRTYIQAMLGAVLAVTLTYAIPVAAIAAAHIPPEHFATGAWVGAARMLAGEGLGAAFLANAVIVGGVLTGVAMFNALTLSYARLPAAMARDGLLPKLFARHSVAGVPWVAVLACSAAWALLSGMSFERLIELDILVYGFSLILEFAALLALRVREPNLPRPFRIPGGMRFLVMLAGAPTALVLFALYSAREERIGIFGHSIPVLVFGSAVVALGGVAYPLARLRAVRVERLSGAPR